MVKNSIYKNKIQEEKKEQN